MFTYLKHLWDNYQQKKQEEERLEQESWFKRFDEIDAILEEREAQRLARIAKRVKEIQNEN
jgi:hypothetical protein